MVDTLLGPEASGESDLACVSGPPFVCSSVDAWCVCVPGAGGWGLVGLLFEICIVDASIN